MTLAANPPIELPLEKLTSKQKWEVVEFLCEDLSTKHLDEFTPPAWHEDMLRERLAKIESGKAVWHDFETTMDRLEAKHR
jgi:hypothetical protein